MPPAYPISPDADDGNHEISTAPTTPNGRLTFSPILQALSLDDEIAFGNVTTGEPSAHHLVRNVCCVGAGYVGTYNLSLPSLLTHAIFSQKFTKEFH